MPPVCGYSKAPEDAPFVAILKPRLCGYSKDTRLRLFQSPKSAAAAGCAGWFCVRLKLHFRCFHSVALSSEQTPKVLPPKDAPACFVRLLLPEHCTEFRLSPKVLPPQDALVCFVSCCIFGSSQPHAEFRVSSKSDAAAGCRGLFCVIIL
jgi:hypothetical protein